MGQPIEWVVQKPESADSVAVVGGRDAVAEIKADGWRVYAKTESDDGRVRLFSRSGAELTGKLPAVEAELARVLPPGSTLDGEIVALAVEDGKLVDRWGSVQSVLSASVKDAAARSGGLTFLVFDLLSHAGIPAMRLPFRARRKLLEQIFAGADFAPCVALMPQFEASGETYRALLAAGYEGMVVKLLDAPYRPGVRGGGWWKLKPTKTADCVIMGWKPGNGSFEGLVGSAIVGQYQDGVLRERCACGSGMTMAERRRLTKQQHALVGAVVEVAYDGVLAEAFRFPRWRRLRPDRSPESCEWSEKECA